MKRIFSVYNALTKENEDFCGDCHLEKNAYLCTSIGYKAI